LKLNFFKGINGREVVKMILGLIPLLLGISIIFVETNIVDTMI